MWCTGGLGLPLANGLRRFSTAALLACLACLTLLASSALAEDLPATDPPAATDPAAVLPAEDPAPPPPAAAEPAPEPPAGHPEHPEHPVNPAPVVDPVIGSPPVQVPVDLGIRDLPGPVATIDLPATTDDPGGPATASPVEARPANGSPPDVALAPSQPDPAPSGGTPPLERRAAAPDPVAVVIPGPGALAPAAWRWPSLAGPSPGAAPVALAGLFLSSAPPVIGVPSTLPGDGGAGAGHRSATRHAPPAARNQPVPWRPDAPGSPVSAGATPPAGAPGGFGGWALACLLFVLLALAAPRRVLPRPALSPVLTLRPACAPARAPPAS